ncbi:hypothetical protein N8009_03335 [Flavobacteriaceae bacterium]|nr:hypothetical protein [Flavobacteriaceae bacterium]
MKIHPQIKTYTLRFALLVFAFQMSTAQGPNAPEAASFEPVDATDMVNLVTGDLSYVLPLLNVPSPEGGYPLALSYHAGIAMDQEASWVGLGWSLNPGAVNRSVNGYPDDWKNGLIKEFAYDEGGSEYSTSISIGYGVPGKWSVGVGVSWGSNQSLGGSVSVSLGNVYGSVGTNGVSAGYGFSDTFGVGASVGFNGSVGASINFGLGKDSNNSLSIGIGHGPGGFTGNVGFTTRSKSEGVGYFSSSSASIGISFSSIGATISGNVNGNGTSASLGFRSSISSSDYNVQNKKTQFMLITPFGYFSYGKNSTKWNLNKTEYQRTQGSMYLYDDPINPEGDDSTPGVGINVYSGKNKFASYYDVFEVNIANEFEQSAQDFYATNNNSLYANFDNYTVSGQGIGGAINPILANNLSLKTMDSKVFLSERNLPKVYVEFGVNENNALLRKPVNFDFQAFANSYLNVLPSRVSFGNNNISFHAPEPLPTIPNTHSFSQNNTLIYLNNSFNDTKYKLRKGRVVEYFTVSDINSGFAASNGYLKEVNNYELSLKNCGYKNTYNYNGIPDFHKYKGAYDNSIAAYKITLEDGKTYHYSLPVYQIEQVRRLYGIVDDKTEDQAHMDRMQVNPYATHWLLTAITGPDYVKNDTNRAYPDEGDYGYWVRFDYGKWSDGYIWKTPTEDVDVFGKVKEYTWGRKQLYYLDKIKTRTHTALFVKKLREDNKSAAMTYKNLGHHFQYTIEEEMNVISHPVLALDKILLLKNEDANSIRKSAGVDLIAEKEYNHFLFATYMVTGGNGYNNAYIRDGNAEIQFKVNQNDAVLDVNDISLSTSSKSIKTIRFSHDYSLAVPYVNPGSPVSPRPGKLTLNNIRYGIGSNFSITPPIKFEYGFNERHHRTKKSDFGYYKNKPQAWSLTSIKTPTGGKIYVDYEPDSYSTLAINNGKVFTSKLKFTFLTKPPTNGTPSKIQIKVEIDDQDPTSSGIRLSDHFDASDKFFMDMWYSTVYNGSDSGYDQSSINIENEMAEIISTVFQSQMTIEVTATSPNFRDAYQHDAEPASVLKASGPFSDKTNQNHPRIEMAWVDNGQGHAYSMRHTLIGNKFISSNSSGLRVKQIRLSDGVGNTYNTNYNYNNPTTGKSSGVLPYYPEQNYNINQQAPYISLLPGPVVTYEHISETNEDISRQYKFKVLEELDTTTPGVISFGDLLEIKCIDYNPINSIFLKYITVYNNLQSLGRIEEVKTLNVINQMISNTKNQYSNLDNEFSLGQLKQSFHSKRNVLDTRNPPYYPISHLEMTDYYGNVSSKIDIYNTLESTTTIQGGFTSTTNFLKHDFLTGQVLETTTTDSKGNRFKTELVPAYTIPEYGSGDFSMGSKVDNSTNKNMLTQEAMSKTYIDNAGDWKETGVGITTWNNNWNYMYYNGSSTTETVANKKIWRKHKSFIWDGGLNDDGTLQGFTNSTPEYDDENFVWTVGPEITQTNADWKNISTTTQYNHYSMPLEVRDINGNYTSTKMGDANSKVYMSANAKYGECFYTGAEDPLASNFIGQQIKLVNGASRVSTYAHTGTQSIQIAPGNSIHVDFISGKYRSGNYKVSVWVKKDNAVNVRIGFGSAPVPFNGEQITAGDWVQLNHYMDLNGSSGYIYIASNSGSIYVDDLRVHPIASSMTSYVYNEWDELWYIIGTNGLASKFEYDAAGRLIKTYSEVIDFNGTGTGGFKQISENNYHYKN